MPVTLLNPRGQFHYRENRIAQRLKSMEGIVLGLLDTSKDNADIFLAEVERLLRAQFSIAAVLKIRKPISSIPAAFTEEFFGRCQAVVNAFGD